MIAHGDGVAWLETLAAHYEETAREIRAVAATIRHEQNASVQGAAHGDGAVKISEAVRRVLADSKEPLKPADVVLRVKRWPINTRSKDLEGLVYATLDRLKTTGMAKKVADGWISAI